MKIHIYSSFYIIPWPIQTPIFTGCCLLFGVCDVITKKVHWQLFFANDIELYLRIFPRNNLYKIYLTLKMVWYLLFFLFQLTSFVILLNSYLPFCFLSSLFNKESTESDLCLVPRLPFSIMCSWILNYLLYSGNNGYVILIGR